MNVIRTRFLTMTQNLNKIVLVIMLLMLPRLIINFKPNEANNEMLEVES